MKKILILIMIICFINSILAAEVNDYWTFWDFSDNSSNTIIDQNGNINLNPKYGASVVSGSCISGYDLCGYTDGTDDRWETDHTMLAENQNKSFLVWMKPVAPENTYDVFAFDNDALYVNDNGDNILVNTKDGSGYDAFTIVSNYAADNSTYYFIWVWTITNSSGSYYCAVLNNESGSVCSTFDGTYAGEGDFAYGSRDGTSSGETQAYFQASGIWNRSLNYSERNCVYQQLLNHNLTFTCADSSTPEESPSNATSSKIDWLYYPTHAGVDISTENFQWKINGTYNYSFEYGTTLNYGSTQSNTNIDSFQELELTGLLSSQLYYWRLNITIGNNSDSKQGTFYTLSNSLSDFSYGFIADFHEGGGQDANFKTELFQSVDYLINESVSFIVLGGDMYEGAGYPGYYRYSETLSERIYNLTNGNMSYYGITGNHDTATGVGGNHVAFMQFYPNPKTNTSVLLYNETNYVFENGAACIIGYSNYMGNDEYNGVTWNWLESSLNYCNSTGKWVIVHTHQHDYNADNATHLAQYNSLFAEYSAIRIGGHIHAAFYNLSDRYHYTVSSVGGSHHTSDFGDFEFEDYVNRPHWGKITINNTMFRLDIVTEGSVILNTSIIYREVADECTPNYVNSSWSSYTYSNGDCLINDTYEQNSSRYKTEYDTNECAGSTTTIYWDNTTTYIACNYCSYNAVYGSWSNVTCGTRNYWDSNYAVCCAVTGIATDCYKTDTDILQNNYTQNSVCTTTIPLYSGPNATGWEELMAGNVIAAAFTMYDTAFVGWTVAILFIVFQFMLLIKTRSLPLVFVTGIFFAGLYGVSVFVKSISVQIIFVILAMELAGILFMLIFKRDNVT